MIPDHDEPAAAGINEESVLILAPTGADAKMIADVLDQAGHQSEIFQDLFFLSIRLKTPAGLLLMAEEALNADQIPYFRQQLAAQAPWSDIPILLLTSGSVSKEVSLEAFELFGESGNLNFLERPLRSITLVSAVRAALKARRRQYQVRDLLDQKEKYVKELKQTNEELGKINKELEEFAYVASHDLQEPLRTVSYYVELLAMQCEGTLDDESRKFVEIVKDGALRAQLLIQDLLEFARIGTRGKPFADTSLEEVLKRALFNLRVSIEETKAVITHDSLPIVYADELQMVQLFQNLISNSIKFRGNKTPEIHVAARQEGKGWHISVSDNGIGIRPEYHGRIFRIFQRLHNKKDYPGTGIGLAVCKKIVERHGGKIWLDSEYGNGTTFHFSLNVQALPALDGRDAGPIQDEEPPAGTEAFSAVKP